MDFIARNYFVRKKFISFYNVERGGRVEGGYPGSLYTEKFAVLSIHKDEIAYFTGLEIDS